MTTKNALIVGCGDLGLRLVEPLVKQGYAVTGLRRTSDVRCDGRISWLLADVTDAASLQVLASQEWDLVIVTLTARGEAAYHAVYVDGVKNILAVLKQSSSMPLLLFASSTSVYAQDDGAWVNEQSATQPKGYSGRTMLLAEQQIVNSGFAHAIVRFSGIYGRNQSSHLLNALRQGFISPAEPLRYSNRIHVDDCVGIFLHLVERHCQNKALQSIYLGSDNCPTPLHSVMAWLAEQNTIKRSELKPAYNASRGSNKRCDNRLLRDSGYEMKYPDYQAGFQAVNSSAINY